MEREFARQYVLSGGNGLKAAILAGYSDRGAGVAAHRCLTRPRVLDEIRRLSIANASAWLPVVIHQWASILCDPEADARARVMAGEKIANLTGAMRQGNGPNVQVNLQVNGQQAQTIIGEVWQLRERRLSDTPGSMSDTSEPPQLAAPATADRGGGALPGSPASPFANTSPRGREDTIFDGAAGGTAGRTGEASDGGSGAVSEWRRIGVDRSRIGGSE